MELKPLILVGIVSTDIDWMNISPNLMQRTPSSTGSARGTDRVGRTEWFLVIKALTRH